MDNVQDALGLSASLFDEGIYVPAIRPPAVDVPRLRLTVTAPHTDEDLKRLVQALKS
jgi:7-keto-8-aminopelargonate synthetase-like enzyme